MHTNTKVISYSFVNANQAIRNLRYSNITVFHKVTKCMRLT